MRQAVEFFGVPQLGPTIIYEDNQAVVSTIRTSRVQEEVHLQTIDVVHVHTASMLADILTKALGKLQFKRLTNAILGRCKLEE